MKIVVLSPHAPPSVLGGVTSAQFFIFKLLRDAGHDAWLLTTCDVPPKEAISYEKYIMRTYVPAWLCWVLQKIVGLFFRIWDRGKTHWQVSGTIPGIIASPFVNRKLQKLAPELVITVDRCALMLFLKKPANCKVIQLEHHNPARFSSPLYTNALPSMKDISLAVALQQRVLRKIDHIICTSHYMERCFHETYTFNGPVDIIPNILDDSFFSLSPLASVAKAIGLPESHKAVYIPCGKFALKGERYVLALMQFILAEHPETVFYISGGITVTLKEEIADSGLSSSVFIPGFLNYSEHLAYIKGCTACLSPSLTENYSMALFEALALGLPVFCFDTGGNEDIVTQGCGALAPFLDIFALAKNVNDFFAAPETHEAMKANALQRAKDIQTSTKAKYLELVGQA